MDKLHNSSSFTVVYKTPATIIFIHDYYITNEFLIFPKRFFLVIREFTLIQLILCNFLLI